MLTQMASRILKDQAASFWLKTAIRAALDRDPVDALNDAETLRDVLEDRLGKIKDQGIK